MNPKRIVCLALALSLILLFQASAMARDSYYIPDSDTRLLTRSELRSYTLSELGYIRNEILARYGYPFKTEKYKSYFDSQDWYVRDPDFSYDWLSATESKNVELIKEIEEEKRNGGSDYDYDDYDFDDDYDDDGDDYRGDYYIYDSDVRLLTRAELRGYSLDELGYIRNEILARHGYPFKTEKYKSYFESQWWYIRDNNFSYDWLSSTEAKNVELIKQIEQEKS